MAEFKRSTEENISDIKTRHDAQFSISTLFWLVTAVAVVVGLYGSSVPSGFGIGTAFWRGLFWSSEVLIALIFVVSLTMLVKRSLASRQLVVSPGHLLLFSGATWAIFWRILQLCGISEGGYVQTGELAPAALGFIVAAISIFGWFKFRWRWRLFFVLHSLSWVGFSAFLIFLASYRARDFNAFSTVATFSWLANVGMFTAVGLSLISVIWDWLESEKHDWLHWCGVVGMWLRLIAPQVLQVIAARYLTPQQLFGG